MLSNKLSLTSPSLTTLYLKMVFSDTVLATGTGFLYEYMEKLYLITNGHNLTGVNYVTKKRLSAHGGFPTEIRSKIKTFVPTPQSDIPQVFHEITLHPEETTFTLYDDDDFTVPNWLIHPQYGYDVGVIALYVCEKNEIPKHMSILPINNLKLHNEYPVDIADDVFILGYPYDIEGHIEMPIWKRGSIATEPSVNLDNLPKLLIDTSTRSGMSGSPVLYKCTGIINKENVFGVTRDTLIGTITGFLGVYSGRIHTEDIFEAQLGIVWKGEVIDEIISGGVKGTIEFQNFIS